MSDKVKQLPTSTEDKLKFEVNEEWDPQVILNMLLARFREPIIKFVQERFYVQDCESYEGGIDSWWGMGSVTLFELGMRFSFHYVENKTIVFIKT